MIFFVPLRLHLHLINVDMAGTNAHPYQKWVTMANIFYLLLGLAWFVVAILNGRFTTFGLAMVIIFGAQLYFKHLITNLVLGIACLLGSVYMLLYAINSAVAAARANELLVADKIMLALCVLSIVMAGVLMFSYLKMGFKD